MVIQRMIRTSIRCYTGLLFALGAVAVLLYLDGKVRDKFEGQRWQVPVQVYGAIEEYANDKGFDFIFDKPGFI